MKQFLFVLIFVLALPCSASAASDGLPSATLSEGEFQIILTVTEPQRIQISNLEDIRFDLSPSDTPNTQSIAPCIFMSGSITAYDLEIAGEVLTDRATEYPYSVKFQSLDKGSVTDQVSLTIIDIPNSAEENAIPASNSATCLDGRTAEVFVSLDQRTNLAATNGQASAKITITVSPTTQ